MGEDQRRLAAIVFTDMVGYTAIAHKDENLALRLLDRQNELVLSFLKDHQGRQVKTIGDALLLEFDSALNAVLCAIQVQDALRKLNQQSTEDERIVVRIGIHVGDVIHRGGDVFGDAVNIASRLVPFAAPGGICVSEHVYGQVRNKIQYEITRIPDQFLKNVDQRIDLYEVVLGQRQEGLKFNSDGQKRVAILPFSNISPDANDSYFADGLTDELISTLSEVKGMRVIARTSVVRFKETTKSIPQIANELQVAYVLEGSVRKAGNRVRVSAQLIDARSQEHTWSDRYDREMGDVLSIQSDIARKVSESLKMTLEAREHVRLGRKGTENSAAYVAYLKGRAYLHDGTEKAVMLAKQSFEVAIQEDASYAKAYSGLADSQLRLSDYLFAPVPTALKEAKSNIEKALQIDPDLSEARASLGNLLMYESRFREAEKEFVKAIALNPSYASAHHWYSLCLQEFDRKDEAWAQVIIAEELDPLSSAIALSAFYRAIISGKFDEALDRLRKLQEIDRENPFVTEALMSYSFVKQDWETALIHLRKMIEADPTDPFLYMDLGYIDAVTGKKAEALEVIEKLKAVPASSRIKGQNLAFVYAGLDDLDNCFKWLDFALENGEVFIGWFRGYPLLEKVRRDPRFHELLLKANLTDALEH